MAKRTFGRGSAWGWAAAGAPASRASAAAPTSRRGFINYSFPRGGREHTLTPGSILVNQRRCHDDPERGGRGQFPEIAPPGRDFLERGRFNPVPRCLQPAEVRPRPNCRRLENWSRQWAGLTCWPSFKQGEGMFRRLVGAAVVLL